MKVRYSGFDAMKGRSKTAPQRAFMTGCQGASTVLTSVS
jgi:hypothetical protein